MFSYKWKYSTCYDFLSLTIKILSSLLQHKQTYNFFSLQIFLQIFNKMGQLGQQVSLFC